MKEVCLDVLSRVLGAGLRQSSRFVDNPAMDHGERYFRMELKAERAAAVTKRLILKNGAFGQGNRILRERKPFAVPLINVAWPGLENVGLRAGGDGLIAGFDAASMVGMNTAAKILGQHLCAKADPEKGFAFGQRYSDPIDLFLNIPVRIVRAHGTAENDRAGMAMHRAWQGIAKSRQANIKRDAIGL